MTGSGEQNLEASHGSAGTSLKGRRVLVTRAERDAGHLVRALESEGAECTAIPLIQTAPPLSWDPLDRVLARLEQYDWVLFTSRNGVRYFLERWARQLDRSLEQGVSGSERLGLPASLKVGAVGPGTADELEKHGIFADIVPEKAIGLGLFDALLQSGVKPAGRRFLLPRAKVARPELLAALTGEGALVDAVTAYRTEPCWESGERLRMLLEQRWPDVITFTSGSAVESCLKLLEPDSRALLDGVSVAAIGPTTADVARQHGLSVDCVADPYTIAGLVAALGNCNPATGRHVRQ